MTNEQLKTQFRRQNKQEGEAKAKELKPMIDRTGKTVVDSLGNYMKKNGMVEKVNGMAAYSRSLSGEAKQRYDKNYDLIFKKEKK